MKRVHPHWLLRLAALPAVVALLVMTTAGAAPGLFHGDGLDHCCEFCHLGHAPILKSVASLTIPAPSVSATAVILIAKTAASQHRLGLPSLRAPPA